MSQELCIQHQFSVDKQDSCHEDRYLINHWKYRSFSSLFDENPLNVYSFFFAIAIIKLNFFGVSFHLSNGKNSYFFHLFSYSV